MNQLDINFSIVYFNTQFTGCTLLYWINAMKILIAGILSRLFCSALLCCVRLYIYIFSLFFLPFSLWHFQTRTTAKGYLRAPVYYICKNYSVLHWPRDMLHISRLFSTSRPSVILHSVSLRSLSSSHRTRLAFLHRS